jgi:hypothetical protein
MWISALEINNTLTEWLGGWLQPFPDWLKSSTCFQKDYYENKLV